MSYSKKSKPILSIATAGLKQNHRNQTPRIDFVELKKYIDINILNYSVYKAHSLGRLFRYLETILRSDLYLAILGLRRRGSYQFVFTMSERAGTPFAGIQKFLPKHTPLVSMFTCWSWRQEYVIQKLNLFAQMDLVIVKCKALKNHFLALGVPEQKIEVIPYGIDHHYFYPSKNSQPENGLILSLGEIRNRDYETLFQAVKNLNIRLVVAASGSWYAREKKQKVKSDIPNNVEFIGKQSLTELKILYEKAQFVVLPIHNVLYSAGATSLMEAMSMEKAVIISSSNGIQDYTIDGETCITVPPGNINELSDAIMYLLHNPSEARRLGNNARHFIETKLNLDLYVKNIAHVLEEFCSEKPGPE